MSTEHVPQESKRKYEMLVVSQHNRSCVIKFNRQDKLNAMNLQMAGELRDALTAAEMDRNIISVILCGDERSFCVGADLEGMKTDPDMRFDAYRALFNVAPNRQLFRVLCFFTKPIISAVEGYCLGGGLEIALWGDLIIGGEAASFGLPEARRGLIPGAGGTQNLTRLIGPARAKELIWTGRRISGAEAKEYGILNHLVLKGQALEKAQTIADEMAECGPLAIMMSKQSINRGIDQSRYYGFLAEADLAHMLTFSEDRREGLQAFSEKRRPNFTGK